MTSPYHFRGVSIHQRVIKYWIFSVSHNCRNSCFGYLCWSTEKTVSVEWPQNVLFFSYIKHAEGWHLSLYQLVKNQQKFFFLLFEKKKNTVQITFEILNNVHFLHILCFEVAVVFRLLIPSLRFFKDSFSPLSKHATAAFSFTLILLDHFNLYLNLIQL